MMVIARVYLLYSHSISTEPFTLISKCRIHTQTHTVDCFPGCFFINFSDFYLYFTKWRRTGLDVDSSELPSQ